ncbi:tetratricopeptide repeat protein [Streptomyces pactum]|uniref:Tetratricopeptide repeat protein n=1 Tax=Streptomyces pactum TaxID=68249 RepID=A0ABS0NJM1_9ACTN|nr:BTAD domain-containing putative transcriptional regulator [Streptomyces pactum]MBH5335299.1 tetratricopeptide repeat protein [Streptomyces pactum]
MAQDDGRGLGLPPRSTVLGDDGGPPAGGGPLHGTGGLPAEDGLPTEDELPLVEARFELALERGGHAQTISELTALTVAHPFRERLRELLMLALYRSGRQAEALAVYADTRRLLADELGTAPGPALTELQHRVRQCDVRLAAPTGRGAAGPGPGAAPVRPAQLPARIADFTGRDTVVAELREQLGTARERTGAVVSVAGTGGIGKTALAVHVAHAARADFPDGQLYADLHGTAPTPADPRAVLGSFLRALGVADAEIPDGTRERAELYRSVLDGRRVLVLLDNARDAAQVRPLLPASAGCAVLATSRTRMADLDGAHLVDLDVLRPDEAFGLFAQIVGEERAVPERAETMDTVGACGFLPLAIRIAAARLAARRTWTVSVLARKLADERRRLDELRAGDLAVKATFELGYGQLEPQQARAFRLLGLADGPDISLHAAAAVLDTDPPAAAELLDALVGSSLLESAVPGRYRYHDLVRLYARACAEHDEPADQREAAMSRLLDFYLATAAQAYAMERPGDRTVEHLTPTARPGRDFGSPAEAVNWLFVEGDCLIGCARQAVTEGLLSRAADLLLVALDLAESGAKLLPYESAAREIAEAARAAGNARAEGRARSTLGVVCVFNGRFEEAERELRRAIELGRAVGDPALASRPLSQLGIIAVYQGRHSDAEEHFARALAAFRAMGDEAGEASALSNLARAKLNLGRTRAGVELAEQSLAIYRRLGGSLRLANGMYALGIALTRVGRADEAVGHLTEALDIFRACRQQRWEGVTHYRLAETHLVAGRPARAAEHAERSLVLGGLGGAWRRGTILTVLGRALNAIGQTGRARACWYEALAIHGRLGSAEYAEVRELLDAPPTADARPGASGGDVEGSQHPLLRLIKGTELISLHKPDEPPAV